MKININVGFLFPLAENCTYKNRTYKPGQAFVDDCRKCVCNKTSVTCVPTPTCSKEKPGQCPETLNTRRLIRPVCSSKCSNDSSCSGDMKCCSSTCGGMECMAPRTSRPACLNGLISTYF